MSEQKNILKKLHAIMSEVRYLQKDAKNPQGWKYLSEAAIKAALHPKLVEHGVIFMVEAGLPQPVTEKFLAVPTKYRFYDVDSGESLGGEFIGTGHTREEKGTYAAITGAIKYTLTSTFLIPTGDDVETEDSGATSGVTDKQIQYIQKMCANEKVPALIAEEVTAWASGEKQTPEEASKYIDILKSHTTKKGAAERRTNIISYIDEHEGKVYPVGPAVANAREKHLGMMDVDKADIEHLAKYATHIREKVKAKKEAEEKAEEQENVKKAS